MKKWYVIYSHHNKEIVAENNLRNQKFDCLSLKYLKFKNKKKIFSFLFPRYLFVSFDVKKDNWTKIFYTRGVKNIFTSQNKPIAVPDYVINNLKKILNNKEIINPFDLIKLYVGKKIKIVDGPFKNKECHFLKKESKDRVKVLLNFLGKLTNLTVENRYLNIA